MQAHQGVIRRAKKIRADGQTVFENQALPLTARSNQENGAQSHGYEPPQSIRAELGVSQRPHSQMNRQTAREQADGVKDGSLEHVLWHGARQALPDIKKV